MNCQNIILRAAQQRFSDYGYAKTSMAEIATDCDMSVGNLYRHFKSKETLAVACMELTLKAKLEAGIQAASQSKQPLESITVFCLARLRIGHAHVADTRHLFDMMELMVNKHRDLLLTYEGKTIQALASLIEEGIKQNAFRGMDSQQTAYDMHQAMLRYNNPIMLKNNPLEILERDLQRLIQLLFQGIRKAS